MSNQIGLFIKKILLGKKNNLISLDEPYEVMRRLLKGHDVTGVIDAGASNGRISKRLLGKFPAADAYAFEPNRLYFDTLQQYSKENPRSSLTYCAASSDFPLPDTKNTLTTHNITATITILFISKSFSVR